MKRVVRMRVLPAQIASLRISGSLPGQPPVDKVIRIVSFEIATQQLGLRATIFDNQQLPYWVVPDDTCCRC